MLILLAIALLFVLPSPWNLVAFLVGIPVWILELLAWNRTVKHRRRVVGAQTLIGKQGVASTACRPRGQIRLDGEIWEAHCDAGAAAGDTVRVIGREALTLLVEPSGAA
jgi:membrane-bound serine protease (ClpP class)